MPNTHVEGFHRERRAIVAEVRNARDPNSVARLIRNAREGTVNFGGVKAKLTGPFKIEGNVWIFEAESASPET